MPSTPRSSATRLSPRLNDAAEVARDLRSKRVPQLDRGIIEVLLKRYDAIT